ncbi:MAG: hypothetical protein EOS73_16045 [Mesorhizobium sp.]|uniref:hypothetical protein n=1 Tax=Mesorhizobium sp. M7A.F.Ca.ET.027.02.1.1 TaxID=2496655 RepID=UPI000FD36C30|nr:hypothetical protein [Mesorhizobium sp. M7A.F.Ca.ET.027.02.1.1]RVD15374.1 hypothetical protein EN749_16245 [Mesorhizobium sp. M7A.F.Ca.ET.027.02.1.1]RWD08193.1 MAG: hypothetical protein EOS73_16045 [Mesorhizobium sp.]
MRDFMNRMDMRRAISPAVAGTDNTAIVSQIIDTAGYEGLVFAINVGANTDANATFAVTMDHGDIANLSDAAAVPAASLTGTLALAGFTAASDDNKLRKIGYVGSKRYVRLTITPTGNDAGNIYVDAIALLFGARYAPTANPPA